MKAMIERGTGILKRLTSLEQITCTPAQQILAHKIQELSWNLQNAYIIVNHVLFSHADLPPL